MKIFLEDPFWWSLLKVRFKDPFEDPFHRSLLRIRFKEPFWWSFLKIHFEDSLSRSLSKILLEHRSKNHSKHNFQTIPKNLVFQNDKFCFECGFLFKLLITLEPRYKKAPFSGSIDGVLGCGAWGERGRRCSRVRKSGSSVTTERAVSPVSYSGPRWWPFKLWALYTSASKREYLSHSFPLIENTACNAFTCSREIDGWK